ncbi:hypothetical protein J7K43_08295 [Candidatus Calescamantes bacterium]|nr:hypothetical protein [Candidatus Calescamantes bacterium]
MIIRVSTFISSASLNFLFPSLLKVLPLSALVVVSLFSHLSLLIFTIFSFV